MRHRKKERQFYEYECTLTGEKFVRTEKAAHPKELVSVKGYYDLHAEEDDRPAIVKKRAGFAEAAAAADTSETPQ